MSYECSGGSLKLKGVSDKVIKKKKKSKKAEKELRLATVSKADLSDNNSNLSCSEASQSTNSSQITGSVKRQDKAAGDITSMIKNGPGVEIKKATKTKAELAFERNFAKRNEEKILERASKSHKEHVENYNRHLESLSEYHDIPKVSWTK